MYNFRASFSDFFFPKNGELTLNPSPRNLLNELLNQNYMYED